MSAKADEFGQHGDDIARSETIDYLFKITDTRMADAICNLVRATQAERTLTVDAVLASLATVLAMHLVAAPEDDESVIGKVGWLSYFIHLQVEAHRKMLGAIMGADNATAH